MELSSNLPELEFCDRAARVFGLLGKRWNGLIIDLLLQRPARFSELARTVPGLSERVLGERLRELEEARLVERIVDTGPPITVTYRLTEVGSALGEPMQSLREWASLLPAPGDVTRPVAEAQGSPARE